MARPKLSRTFEGVTLADHLYSTNRPNYWRYQRPDNSWRYFSAIGVEAANRIANENNARRHTMPTTRANQQPGRDSLLYWIRLYIQYRERQDPNLVTKSSWINRTYALKAFGHAMASKPIGHIKRDVIDIWWLQLTHHQQKLRHAEFRRLFNWLMGQCLCPRLDYNPFTTADDRPRFYLNGEPEKSRMPCVLEDFWKIYDAAGSLGYQCLQIAMGISLTTFMRESDICSLKIDEHLRDSLLRRVIGKSEAQRGTANASRLSWDQTNYGLLRQLIARGMQLSLLHERCPYLISHTPKQKRIGKTKTHTHQVTPRRLMSMFNEARIVAKVHLEIPDDRTPTTFHEIRGLASALATTAGYELKVIQQAMAHENEATTRGYQDEHDLPYEQVPIIMTAELLGRDFG
ncbi:MAG: tyrosine-type recombinase/integrase [Pseudohongiella sp.]|nr:tyrosine-type recombinase/integrase [Pseudohongiella sp.]